MLRYYIFGAINLYLAWQRKGEHYRILCIRTASETFPPKENSSGAGLRKNVTSTYNCKGLLVLPAGKIALILLHEELDQKW